MYYCMCTCHDPAVLKNRLWSRDLTDGGAVLEPGDAGGRKPRGLAEQADVRAQGLGEAPLWGPLQDRRNWGRRHDEGHLANVLPHLELWTCVTSTGLD